MNKIKLAINGFGRIGRLVLRALCESGRKDVEVVAINDPADIKTQAHLLSFDSIHGRFPFSVINDETHLKVAHQKISVFSEKDPKKLPWSSLGVDIVLECSGHFTEREQALLHLQTGAKKVLISAPATNEDLTVVYGVNHKLLKPAHRIVSNASCTTNCLAPIASVMDQTVGIEKGCMTTIHAYTGDQRLIDTAHKDLHRARAAALSMIPTSTGAAKAVGLVIPHLKGKLDGMAIRVPTPNVSVVDFKFLSKRRVRAEELNQALQDASSGMLKGIMDYTTSPLVSIDFNHDAHSAIVDGTHTRVVDGTLCSVLAWYDNEWGFSNRMLDTAAYMAQVGYES